MSWTPLEFAANFMTLVCIFLAGRNNVHTWWTGIVACILFGALFFQAKLYADVTLQVFFIVTGIIGWWSWTMSRKFQAFKAGKSIPLGPTPKPITRASNNSILTYLLIGSLAALAYGFILHSYTDAYAPWIDSAVLSLSVIAQLLLMRRQLQTWMFWVVVNTLAVSLFWSRELYLTSALYAVFWVHAFWAWKNWLNLMDEQVKPAHSIKTLNEA